MKLLLTSAGVTNEHIRDELQRLAGRDFSEVNLVFVTTAANQDVDDKGWLVENINQLYTLGFKSFNIIDIAGLSQVQCTAHLDAADIICFGGGDEMYLHEVLQSKQVDVYLQEALAEKVYMGISAGSMVAGTALPSGVSQMLFSEDDHTGSVGGSMELCALTFIPHLNSPYFNSVRTEVLQEHADTFAGAVYAPDDETALSVVDGKVRVIGDGAIWTKE